MRDILEHVQRTGTLFSCDYMIDANKNEVENEK